jgi:hypothetical protein
MCKPNTMVYVSIFCDISRLIANSSGELELQHSSCSFTRVTVAPQLGLWIGCYATVGVDRGQLSMAAASI